MVPRLLTYPKECHRDLQGISVGWADIYDWTLPQQWIMLGSAMIPDGGYVLRSVADPLNQIMESPGGADARRESEEANEAATSFRLEAGTIVVRPSSASS